MKQLGLALAQYAQDSDGLPPLIEPSVKRTWRETLYPFVKSTAVYRCPDDPYFDGPASPENLPWSYTANHTGWGKIRNENRVILLADVRGDDGPEWDMTNPIYAPKYAGWQLYTHKPHHFFFEHPVGTLNCLFTDGHVKALKPMATLTPVNLWTRDNAPFMGQDLSNAQAILKHAEDE